MHHRMHSELFCGINRPIKKYPAGFQHTFLQQHLISIGLSSGCPARALALIITMEQIPRWDALAL
jgi:hypothetical protein